MGGGAALRHLWNNVDTPLSASADSLESAPVPAAAAEDKMRGKEARQAVTDAGLMTSQLWESIMIPVKEWVKSIKLSPERRTFIANVVASSVGILLLQAGRERAVRLSEANPLKVKRHGNERISPTLDLTLLLLVRALDSLVQSFIHSQIGWRDGDEAPKAKDHHHSAAEPNLVRDLLEKEQKRRKNVFIDKLTTRIDALLFWACSAR